MRFKSAIDISRIEKIDKNNFNKFSNSRNNNLFQFAIIQILRQIDVQTTYSQEQYFELLLSFLKSKFKELQSQDSIAIYIRFQLNSESKYNIYTEQK